VATVNIIYEAPPYSTNKLWRRKLLMLPKLPGQQCSISRPELWGPPTAFGSAGVCRVSTTNTCAALPVGKGGSNLAMIFTSRKNHASSENHSPH